MRFTKLAAVLGLAAQEELDEGRAVAAVEALSSEISSLRADKERLTRERDDARAASNLAVQASARIQIDTLIAEAYRAGKMIRGRDELGNEIASPREARLRRIGAEVNGIDSLRAEIAEMETVVPLRRSQSSSISQDAGLSDLDDEGGDDSVAAEDITLGAEVRRVARQLGLKQEEVKAYLASRMNGGY